METVLTAFINTLESTMKSLMREVGESSGMSALTINQLHYIDAISALDAPTITEVAERLGITKPSVTAGINKLVQLGFVVKVQSSVDRRVFHVRLTGSGEKLVQARSNALRAYNEFIISSLNSEEAEQLEMILTKLVMRFEQEKK